VVRGGEFFDEGFHSRRIADIYHPPSFYDDIFGYIIRVVADGSETILDDMISVGFVE